MNDGGWSWLSSPTCITATTGAAWRRCRIECLADFILVSGLSMFSACLSSSPRSGTLGVCIGHEVDERWVISTISAVHPNASFGASILRLGSLIICGLISGSAITRRILSAHNGPDFSNFMPRDFIDWARYDVCFRINSTVCWAKLLFAC